MDIPKNWLAAHDFYTARRFKGNRYRNIGGNTSVVQRGWQGNAPIYAVLLYITDIITYYPDGSMDLDAYKTKTTNARRDDAGKPTIHRAVNLGMTAAKANRLEDETRWSFHGRGITERFPYGLPARDLKLDKNGHVTHIDRCPIDDFKEGVLMPIKDAQKERRRVLRRTRELLKPWAVMTEALGQSGYFDFDFGLAGCADCEAFIRAAEIDEAEAIHEFIGAHWTSGVNARGWVQHFPPVGALEVRIRHMQPAQNHSDKTLWRMEYVHPSNLDELLG